MPKNDNRFELVQAKLSNKLLLAELVFSLYIANKIEPFSYMFPS